MTVPVPGLSGTGGDAAMLTHVDAGNNVTVPSIWVQQDARQGPTPIAGRTHITVHAVIAPGSRFGLETEAGDPVHVEVLAVPMMGEMN